MVSNAFFENTATTSVAVLRPTVQPMRAVVLIISASSELGRNIAFAFVRRGYRLAQTAFVLRWPWPLIAAELHPWLSRVLMAWLR